MVSEHFNGQQALLEEVSTVGQVVGAGTIDQRVNVTSAKVDEVRTYRQQVLEAVRDLHDQGLTITRASLIRATGLKTVTVDECLKDLKRKELIWSPERGVFRPTESHPPARPMSKTILPNGLVKIEIGDEVLTLTPKENRMLAELQGGAAAQLAAIEGANSVAEIASLAYSVINSLGGFERRQALVAAGFEQA